MPHNPIIFPPPLLHACFVSSCSFIIPQISWTSKTFYINTDHRTILEYLHLDNAIDLCLGVAQFRVMMQSILHFQLKRNCQFLSYGNFMKSQLLRA